MDLGHFFKHVTHACFLATKKGHQVHVALVCFAKKNLKIKIANPTASVLHHILYFLLPATQSLCPVFICQTIACSERFNILRYAIDIHVFVWPWSYPDLK